MARVDQWPPTMNPFKLPDTLLSRVEDAGINASAPPQQRWVDGWLLRFSPGKAKRARCVQAVADGRLPQAGFVKQEDVPLADFLANRFGRVYAMEELSKAA